MGVRTLVMKIKPYSLHFPLARLCSSFRVHEVSMRAVVHPTHRDEDHPVQTRGIGCRYIHFSQRLVLWVGYQGEFHVESFRRLSGEKDGNW